MGLPVVGTSQAFQGVQATLHDGIRTADEPHAFAQELCAVLTATPAKRRQFAQQARHYVESHHQWQDQAAKLEQLLTAAVHAPLLAPEARVSGSPSPVRPAVGNLDQVGVVSPAH